MATPTWNQITAPNFSAGNSLIVQAMDQLTKAGEGLQGVAKDYKDTLYKRNLGAIQEYVNSAKTPEELESEGFRTGLARLTGTMAGEYDTLAKAQVVDKAKDTLLSRKANQVSIDTNQFNLDTGRKNQLTKEFTNKILAAPPEQRDALRQAAINANAYDFGGVTAGDLGIAQLLSATQQNKLRDATWDDLVKAPGLVNAKTIAETGDIKTNNDIAWYNALTQRAQAEAAAAKAEEEKNKNKNAYIGTGLAAIDTAKKDVKEKIYGSGLNTDPEKSWKKWEEKTTAGVDQFDAAPNKAVELIDNHPELRELPDNLKILHAENALRYLRKSEVGSNPAWWFTSNSEETILKQGLEESFKNFNQQASTAEDNATIPIYRKTVLEHAQKTGASGYAAAKDLGLDELTIYKAGIPSQLAAEAKIKYASSDKSIPESQFIENEINIATNPDYATSNAPLFPEQPKTDYSNVYRPSPGRGAGGIKRKATEIVPSVQNSTPTSTDSLQEQQQRMEAAALARLTAAALKQNGRPPVTPALIAKPEETKPRELTPAEKQQAERMNQEALVRLTGAKLTEKQAEVQKQFPTTPLKQLAKAATPVPSPLIPVESQNAFRVKENNLALDFRTGKGTPTKEPVPMPKVTWKEPVQAVTINPIYAQLPQHKVVATFVPDADGDTISATSDTYKTKGERAKKAGGIICRLDSIEAPETAKPQYGKKGQPYGEEAAKILQQMVLNKEISIRVTEPTDGESNYGRDVCQIEVAGKDVSVELLRAGAAWLYKEYNHYGQGGFDLESTARQSKSGLWGLGNPVYPPDFRHNGYQNP